MISGGEVPIELTLQVIAGSITAVMGTATLVTTLLASIFATTFPVATVVACAALVLIATVWIVDMYCSYYDYIYTGDLNSYTDAQDMSFQLYMLGDFELIMSQFIFAKYAAPYLKETTNRKPTVDMEIDSRQLGQKWGKHRIDYPEMTNYSEYEQFAKNIFNNPDKIIYDSANGEYLYIQGNNLLRIKLNGEFVSLYPGAESSRVINAIERGGLLWEK